MNFLAGHYTQIINDNVVAIGCGATQCGNSYYMYCNYATGQMDTSKPYVSGTPCTNCSSGLCTNGLCNCNKVCLNDGTLDTKTCTCLCYPYATGEFCEKLTCNLTDAQLGCWTPGDTSLCQYSNTVVDCPFTCGVCSKTLIPQTIQTATPSTSTTTKSTTTTTLSTSTAKSSTRLSSTTTKATSTTTLSTSTAKSSTRLSSTTTSFRISTSPSSSTSTKPITTTTLSLLVVPPTAPTSVGSSVYTCNQQKGFSLFQSSVTVCNMDSSGKSRQASEVNCFFFHYKKLFCYY